MLLVNLSKVNIVINRDTTIMYLIFLPFQPATKPMLPTVSMLYVRGLNHKLSFFVNYCFIIA